MHQAQQQVKPATPARAEPVVRLPVLPTLTAIIELIVLFGLIIGLDVLLDGVDIAAMQPHPFWLPILVLSLQYGTVSGLLAAGVACALSALQGFPAQEVGENYFAYFVRVWGQPMLWIAVAVVLGQFRLRQIEAKRSLLRSLHELEGQRIALADYAENLRARCDRLEQEIAAKGEVQPFAALKALADARAADGGAAADRLGRVVGALLPGASAAVFVLGDRRLERIAAIGAAAGRAPSSIAAGEPLFQRVVDEGNSVSVLDVGGEHVLGPHGLMAVPLPTLDGVGGLMTVTPARAEEVSAGALAALAIAAEALVPALAVAAAVGSLASGQPSVAVPRLQRRRVPWRRRAGSERHDAGGDGGGLAPRPAE